MTGKISSMKIGTNIAASLDGDILTLKIDISERNGKSASGKTTIVATSSGNQMVPGTPVIIGVNAYVKE